MYLDNSGRTYSGKDGQQRHSRAPFLILVQHEDRLLGPDNFRALVRKVALKQFGNWMTGTAGVKGKYLFVSGAYGNNGLPVTVSDDKIWNAAVPVPRRLYDLWAKSGGWNSVGEEAMEMKKWAVETFKRPRLFIK